MNATKWEKQELLKNKKQFISSLYKLIIQKKPNKNIVQNDI